MLHTNIQHFDTYTAVIALCKSLDIKLLSPPPQRKLL